MAGLHEKLLVLFPDYKEGDWTIIDKGDGVQVLGQWNRVEPRPIKNTIDNVTDKTASDKFKEVLNNKAISQDPVIGALLRVIARTTNTNVVNVNLMMIEELSK